LARIFSDPLSNPKLTSLQPAFAIFSTNSSSAFHGYRMQRQVIFSSDEISCSHSALAYELGAALLRRPEKLLKTVSYTFY
jgi:hypothetical protein